jgi:hypothetical protein
MAAERLIVELDGHRAHATSSGRRSPPRYQL